MRLRDLDHGVISFDFLPDGPRGIKRGESSLELVVPVDGTRSLLIVVSFLVVISFSLLSLVLLGVSPKRELPVGSARRRRRSSDGVFCSARWSFSFPLSHALPRTRNNASTHGLPPPFAQPSVPNLLLLPKRHSEKSR
jgi:hypothetical protein